LSQGSTNGGLGSIGQLGDLPQGATGQILLGREREQTLALLNALAHRRGALELRQRLENRPARVRHQ